MRDFSGYPEVKLLDFYGHVKSNNRSESIDSDEDPTPWFTYPAIYYLKQLDLSNMTVFEYGCGNSTLFWASRAKSVYSVDHDPEWLEKTRARTPANSVQTLANGVEYVNAIELMAPHDIIVVDGRWRFDCADASVKFLKRDGAIILDNSERYPSITRNLRGAGFIQIDFIGYGPINWYTWCTSLFISRTWRPRSLDTMQPNYTPGNVDSFSEDPERFLCDNRSAFYLTR